MNIASCASMPVELSRGSVTAARVCRPLEDGDLLVDGGCIGRARARLAVPGYQPQAGDRVLVATDESGSRYVVGVLGQLRAATERSRVAAADGSSVAVATDEQGREVLRITDATGQLLVEHRPAERTTVLTGAAHHLELRAAGKLRLAGAEGIELASPAALDVTVGSLGVTARRADLEADDVDLTAQTVTSTAERVRSVARVLEVRVHRIVERAHEVFRDVDGLAQTRAGRLKLLAEHALQLVGRHAEVRAYEDVKVKGDRIYLG